MRTYNKNGSYPFKAHDRDCANAFKVDRAAGLIYGTVEGCMDWEESSREYSFCAYCGTSSSTTHDF